MCVINKFINIYAALVCMGSHTMNNPEGDYNSGIQRVIITQAHVPFQAKQRKSSFGFWAEKTSYEKVTLNCGKLGLFSKVCDADSGQYFLLG